MRKFDLFPIDNLEMLDGIVAADLGIDFIKKGIVPLSDDLKQAAEKFLVDEETEESEPVKGTRRPSDRAARRKATAKAKRKAKKNEPFTCSLVDHGEYVIHKGNTHSWHPEWKRIDRRIRRHEGKNLCFHYEAEDETETEDWEDLELLEELEKMERKERMEWLQEHGDTAWLGGYDPEDFYWDELIEREKEEAESEAWGDEINSINDIIDKEWWLIKDFVSEYNLTSLYNEWKKRREA